MWNLNGENESNVEPWDVDEYVDNRDANLGVGRVEPIRDSGIHLPPKRIVQVYVFRGSERYDDFNEFAKRNNIGDGDIISIADDENRLVLFYLK